MMLLAVLAALALVIPAAASASQWVESGTPITEPLEWTDGGTTLTGEQAISLEGPIKFSNATSGGVECSYVASGTLSAGSEGVLSEFAPISLGGCKLNGAAKTSCLSVTSATIYSWWPLEVAEKSAGVHSMTIKMGKIVFTFQPKEGEAGKLCPAQIELTGGSITATPDNEKSMSSVSLTGPVSGGKLGNFNTTGTLAVKPAARFGAVRRENVAALSGSIRYSNASWGSVECAVTGSLTLRPGEKGEVTAMSSKAGSCGVSGVALITECGSTATAVFKELPWSVSITASKAINIAKFPFEVQFSKGCIWKMNGEMLATPNNTSAIASTTLSGTLTGEPFPMKWTGSLNWSPSGKYGIS